MELKAEKITKEKFFKYGTFLDPLNIYKSLNKSSETTKFFPDRLPLAFMYGAVISLSILWLRKRPFEFNCA